MDNNFNEEYNNSEEFTEDRHADCEIAEDYDFEPGRESADAEYEPVSDAMDAVTYEPADTEHAQHHKHSEKRKKPLSWKRVIPAMIGIGVGGFVLGVLISVFLIFPAINIADSIDFSYSSERFEDFDDFFDNFTDPFRDKEDNEKPNSDSGTKKEAESFDEHPAELPSIGGNAPIITDHLNPVPDIAEQLSDGVVLITTELTMQYVDGAEETNQVSGGTGFVISEDGYIVTNNHVIEGGSSFIVTLPNGSEYSAVLVGTDTETDLAVLKISAKEKLTVLPIGDSDHVRTGEMVIAIGNASGAGATLTGSVTVGYVSAVNREISFNGTQQEFIQTDAALNSGNSGGPLVNTKGEVIGVATLKSLISSYTEYGESINSEGIGFAIPINRAMEKVQQIILSGNIKKPGIGLNYYAISKEQSEKEKIPMGLLIASFMSDSPSEEAGLMVGDIIVKADGISIEKIESISEYIGAKGIGSTIDFTVYREGKYLDFTVEIRDVNAMR